MDTEDERRNDGVEYDLIDENSRERTQEEGRETQREPSTSRDDSNSAPRFSIPKRAMGAVEIPMIVMNLDRAEKAFGSISSFQNVGVPGRRLSCDINSEADPRHRTEHHSLLSQPREPVPQANHVS